MTQSVSARTRQYFIANTVIGAAIVNAVINGAFGWLATVEYPVLPLWGAPSVAIDTVLTAFGVAFGTALVVVHQARKDLFAGKAWPEQPTGVVGVLVDRLPPSALGRGALLGLGCVVVFVPVPVFVMALAGVEALSAGDFIAFKAGFSAVVGAIVTPLIALHAMVAAQGRTV